jgi:hypothetical protein
MRPALPEMKWLRLCRQASVDIIFHFARTTINQPAKKHNETDLTEALGCTLQDAGG